MILVDGCTIEVLSELACVLQQVRQLQKVVEARDEETAAVHECMARVASEFGALDRLAQSAAATATFGTEPEETAAKMTKIVQRMQVLQQVSLSL